MSYADEIDKALLAHGTWKRRLLDAVQSGKSDFSVNQVQVDNRCEFGKWLYGLPSEVRESAIGKEIQAVHADFHTEAARILDMALKGQRAPALEALELQSKYAAISGRLALAMQKWKHKLA
jgi:hypothetical protein